MIYTHFVTLNVTPNWQPTSEDTGKTCEFWCGLASFRVEWTKHDGQVEYMHGAWASMAAAHKFAVSMPNQLKPKAVACEPYMYAPAYGRIEGQPTRIAPVAAPLALP